MAAGGITVSPSSPSYPTPTSPPAAIIKAAHGTDDAKMDIDRPLVAALEGGKGASGRSHSPGGRASEGGTLRVRFSDTVSVQVLPASSQEEDEEKPFVRQAPTESFLSSNPAGPSLSTSFVTRTITTHLPAPSPLPTSPRRLSPDPHDTKPFSHSPSLASSPAASPRPRLHREASSMERKPSLSGGSDNSGSGNSTPVSRTDSPAPSGSALKGGRGKGKGKKVKEVVEAQLIGDLPLAEEEALSTFTELTECTYASKALGNLAYYDEDSMRCDCSYDPGSDEVEQACGEDSQCMNRLMQIECVKGDCRCQRHCQNQRFQNKEYAPIEIVKTEKKGFGVRTSVDLPQDTFIYEYVGEVIGPVVFARKMKEYGAEGIRHFYFMALDKDIFIDATKRGGKGRFLNHSCNPNCFVAKWTVGRKMRMGIFSKRNIKKDEELTFNYNVDRYGHTAQECYCGEPNCVGYIGGKTQTDIGGMDDLYLEALGIAEEVEALGLRGTKKKKGKKLDEDFMALLKPIDIDEVPKVAAAVRQAITNRRILEKLLARMQMTNDAEAQSQFLRLHGFVVMGNVLKEYASDMAIITLVLEILSKWPLITRNKLEATKMDEGVKRCAEMDDAKVQLLALNLLATWDELELGFRIKKIAKELDDDGERKRPAELTIEHIAKRARLDDFPSPSEVSRPAFIKPEASIIRMSTPIPPAGWKMHRAPDSGKPYYENVYNAKVQWLFPTAPAVDDTPKPVALDVNAIIAQVQAEADALAEKEAKAREAELEAKKKAAREAKGKGKDRAKSAGSSAANKEKRVMSLFSPVVVGVMNKYRDKFDTEQFKTRAREVTQTLIDKEKKKPNFDSESYDKLSSEKTSKIKMFVKEWIVKLVDRKGAQLLGRKGSKHSTTPSASATPTASTSAPSPSTASTPRIPSSYVRPNHNLSPHTHVPSPRHASPSPPRPSSYETPASYERPVVTNGGYSNGGPSEQQYADLAAAMGIGALGGEQRDVVMEEQGTPPGTPPSRRKVLQSEGWEGGV